MSEAQTIDFGKLAKDTVSSRLKGIEDTAPVAAEIAHKTIVAAVTSARAKSEDPAKAVESVCRGTLSGLVLIDKDLVSASMAILGRLAQTAQDVHVDPQELLTWALQGIAKVSPMLSAQALWKLREQIEAKFMGVGPIFDEMCENARKEKK